MVLISLVSKGFTTSCLTTGHCCAVIAFAVVWALDALYITRAAVQIRTPTDDWNIVKFAFLTKSCKDLRSCFPIVLVGLTIWSSTTWGSISLMAQQMGLFMWSIAQSLKAAVPWQSREPKRPAVALWQFQMSPLYFSGFIANITLQL